MLKWSLLANLTAASSTLTLDMKPYTTELGTGLGASHEGQTGSYGYSQVVTVQIGG